MVKNTEFSRVDQLIEDYGNLQGYSTSQKFNMREFLNSVAHNIKQKLDNNKESIEKLDTELKSYLIMNEKYTNLSGFIADKMLDMIYEDFTNKKNIFSESLLKKTQNFDAKDWTVQKEIVEKINNIIKKYTNITIKNILEEFGNNIKDKKSRQFFQEIIKNFQEEPIYKEIKDKNPKNKEDGIYEEINFENTNIPNTTMNHKSSEYQELNKTNKNPS